MKGFLIFIGGAIIGAVLSFFVATDIGAGAGIVVGMQTGACMMAEAAKEKGFITEDQINELWGEAQKLIASSGVVEEGSAPQGTLDCESVVADLKAAAASAK
jgi:hypothetical protein